VVALVRGQRKGKYINTSSLKRDSDTHTSAMASGSRMSQGDCRPARSAAKHTPQL